jgi:hypothetical protein
MSFEDLLGSHLKAIGEAAERKNFYSEDQIISLILNIHKTQNLSPFEKLLAAKIDTSLKYLKSLIEKWGGNPKINNPKDAIEELEQLVRDREENV